MTVEQLKESIENLINSGIALSGQTISDIMRLIDEYSIQIEDIDSVKNNEIRISLYEYYKKVPKNNVDFLRYMVYRLTGETLLIKSKDLIGKIKLSVMSHSALAYDCLRTYEKEYGLERLAEIFYRYKPVWLAFKNDNYVNCYINKIRKLAIRYHKPLKQDLLNNLTNSDVSVEKLEEKLRTVDNIFRKIRLLNSIGYRITKNEEFLYRIRNGKSFVETKNPKYNPKYPEYYSVIMESIVNDIKPKVEGKKIFIPKNVVYALPSSEKQFIGNIPNCSYISTGKRLLVGVHWFNKPSSRVDLDLKIQNLNEIYGWDTSYRSSDIYFTGDITDAPKPNGALEAFYIGETADSNYLLVLNNYTYDSFYKENNGTEFKLVIDEPESDRIDKNYIIDHNTVLATFNLEMKESKNIIGFVNSIENEKRVYISNFSIGKGITSRMTEEMSQAYRYYINYSKSIAKLNSILDLAGAIIVDNKEDCDIDLSLENITKDSIISLLTKDN